MDRGFNYVVNNYIIFFCSGGELTARKCDGDTFPAIIHFNKIEFCLLDTCIQEDYFNSKHLLSQNVLRGCQLGLIYFFNLYIRPTSSIYSRINCPTDLLLL